MAGNNETEAGSAAGTAGVSPALSAVRAGGPRSRERKPLVPVVIAALVVAVALWFFPLFRVVPLKAPESSSGLVVGGAAFDPVAVAAKLWSGELAAAAQRAPDVSAVAAAIRADASAARKKYARSSGLGTAYYFVRGSGKVVAQDSNYLRVGLELPAPALVALRIGPVFGNAVRDGSGLLDVNRVPGLQEFNALAAELNALVEKNVLPSLRERAAIGATVTFAGCAEAPESAAAPGEPLLTIVPVTANVR